MERKPLLMDADGYGNKEAMMDYVMTWTLKHAAERFGNGKPILNKYCREVLFHLLGIDDFGKIKVKEVTTHLQRFGADVTAEITIESGTQESRYALLIEDKAYTKLHDDQLARYKKIFEEYYNDSGYELRYAVVVLPETMSEAMREESKRNGFEPFCIEDLPLTDWQEDSESDLFNEFWLRYWG